METMTAMSVSYTHLELRDYETFRKLGIPMPKLLAVDMEQERSAASSVALNGGIFTKVFQIF